MRNLEQWKKKMHAKALEPTLKAQKSVRNYLAAHCIATEYKNCERIINKVCEWWTISYNR